MLNDLSFSELFGVFGTAVTIFGGGVQLGRKLSGRANEKELERLQQALQEAERHAKAYEANLQGLRSLLDDQADVWLRMPPDMATHLAQIRASIPIITVCNFKGGVGKTALTTLLAGYFDLHKQKRVLLVDFDYQGSLTDTLLASADLPELEASSRRLLEEGRSPEDAIAHSYLLHPALTRTRLFTCFLGFNRIENKLMMRWIAEMKDCRYLTHTILSSPAVQKAFDLVIIDAPPRLSSATVNAFCASTHVLLPTILDSMSTQAALNTLKVVRDFRQILNPGLEVLGVVPTMVNRVDLNTREKDSLERLVARLPEYWKQVPMPHVFREQPVYRREAVATALGSELAFNSSDEVRRMTVSLGDALVERLFAHEPEELGAPAKEGGNVTSISKRRA